MPEVTLNVSPLVKRIFESKYGEGVAHIKRQDINYRYLQGDPLIANAHRSRILQELLTEHITLNVSSLLAKRLRRDRRRLRVGFYLHKIYQEQLLYFVEAQVMAGQPAQTAMKAWLQMNGVQEDDYGLDSAYTAWKRRKSFLEKIKKNSNTKKEESDQRSVNDCSTLVSPPYDPRDVLIAVHRHLETGYGDILRADVTTDDGQTHIYSGSSTRDIIYARSVYCYILSQYCWMPYREISKMVKVQFTVIGKYVNKIKFEVNAYPEVKQDVARILALCPYLCRTTEDPAVPVL